MMIDRKALWITSLIVVAMIAANIWRLSLLPDWRHVPAVVAGSTRMVPSFWAFPPPLIVLLMMGMFLAINLKFGPKEASPEKAMQFWRHQHGMALVFGAGTVGLAQAFSLARSLGALQSVDPPTFRHVVFVAAGIFLMVFGNMMPKMPWLTERFSPLDPWQWNRHRRFQGKFIVALGLFFAVAMPLLSLRMVVPLSIGLSLTLASVSLWHRVKMRRESLPQP
jgi:hypothetical protein